MGLLCRGRGPPRSFCANFAPALTALTPPLRPANWLTNHGERRQRDGRLLLRAGACAVLVHPVAGGLLAHHTDLLGVVRPEDHPAPAAALLVGGGPALRRLLWLRRVERLPQRLAELHRAGRRVHLRQQQLVLLDRRHRHLPVRVYRQVQSEGG